MTWTLIAGDCVEVMRGMDPASVDAVVTDPPYGLEFMGKEWDNLRPLPDWEPRSNERAWAMQTWHQTWAIEALRVLKPGGHLLSFGGTRTYHRLVCALEDAGFEIRDCLAWLYGSGFPKSLNLTGEWQGWGTALKPAFEPIVLARKPLSGTVAENVLRHGTGALNVDGTRIEAGRWPANVLLDADAAAALDEQSGEASYNPPARWKSSGIGGYHGVGEHGPGDIRSGFGDRGGASRFFYTAKTSRSERENGVREYGDAEPRMAAPYNERPSGQLNAHLHGADPPPRRNSHPTVKPVDLMQWLCRLITPPAGLILDPFTGSGSTGIAALREGFSFIGIEREADYVEIARARIIGDAPLFNVGAEV